VFYPLLSILIFSPADYLCYTQSSFLL